MLLCGGMKSTISSAVRNAKVKMCPSRACVAGAQESLPKVRSTARGRHAAPVGRMGGPQGTAALRHRLMTRAESPLSRSFHPPSQFPPPQTNSGSLEPPTLGLRAARFPSPRHQRETCEDTNRYGTDSPSHATVTSQLARQTGATVLAR